MKKIFFNFIRRGLMVCGLGPLILAVLYLILQHRYNIQTLTVTEVCIGIISISALSFIAGGINEIYQIERLPLVFSAIFVFGFLAIWAVIYFVIRQKTAKLNAILKEKQSQC